MAIGAIEAIGAIGAIGAGVWRPITASTWCQTARPGVLRASLADVRASSMICSGAARVGDRWGPGPREGTSAYVLGFLVASDRTLDCLFAAG